MIHQVGVVISDMHDLPLTGACSGKPPENLDLHHPIISQQVERDSRHINIISQLG